MDAANPTRTVWQLAGGPASRMFADVFLKYGVGLIGPGDAGSWTPERDDDEFEGGFVRRLSREVKVGDVFLLRTGMSTICAVGIVASEYMYLNQFDDVNGWDLQHGRRVRWGRLPQEYKFGESVFGSRAPVNQWTRSENPTQWLTAGASARHLGDIGCAPESGAGSAAESV